VFEGTLGLEPAPHGGTILRMTGTYEPPLGPVGAFGDVVMGRRLGRQSIELYLERIARHIYRTVTTQLALTPRADCPAQPLGRNRDRRSAAQPTEG